MQTLRESLALIRGSLIQAVVLLVIVLVAVIIHAWLMRRRGEGIVPRAQLVASTMSCAFVLSTLHMCYLAWAVVPRLLASMQLANTAPPMSITILRLMGDLHVMPTPYTLPTMYVGVPYFLLAGGVGLWIAAVTEGVLADEAIPRLRRITLVTLLGTLAVLAVSSWALVTFWRMYRELNGGL